jgi:hypothetical protein
MQKGQKEEIEEEKEVILHFYITHLFYTVPFDAFLPAELTKSL